MIRIYGPYLRKDGRMHVIQYEVHTKKRTTISYPKFLMEEKLGRKLESWETVDHIDEDISNNKLENLQILSRVENAKKSAVLIGEFTNCSKCGIEIYRPMSRISEHNFCSNSCRGKFYGNQYQQKPT